MDLLTEARTEIDQVDQEIAALFLRRMNAVKKVILHKKEHNLPILDAGREEAVIQKNLALLPADAQELAPFYRDFLQSAMGISRHYQAQILASDKVAYQGRAGAFSHIAMKILFPHGREQAYETWKEVFTAVDTGQVNYGVLPFENSHAGDVSEVLDLCFSFQNIQVCAMHDLPVHQNLLGVPGAKIQDIKTVVSHPQALSQSSAYLDRLGVERQSYPNTAAAAEYVAQLEDKLVGAIASAQTAELYNLNILAYNINESADNTTRFLVITREKPVRGNRFSLLFTVKHQSGSLAKVITTIANQGFNMESIKSRPMPQVSWEYYFYTELVGTAQQAEELRQALDADCQTLRVLGIYEREEKPCN